MEPEEFTDPKKTVYKYEQVLTREDLQTFYENLGAVYDATPVIFMLEKDRLMIALKTVDTLITWIDEGKNPGMYMQI